MDKLESVIISSLKCHMEIFIRLIDTD